MANATTSESDPLHKPTITHPTKVKLRTTALTLMKTMSVEAVTADQVLQHSGVSKGSLYHHYTDFPSLIEDCLAYEFSENIDLTIDELTLILTTSTSKDEVFATLEKITLATQAPERRDFRLRRARILSHTENNPRFAQVLAQQQQRLTAALTDLFKQCQLKGWMNSDFDPHAAAVLIQAYTLGKIVDDVTAEPMDPQQWNALITRLVERVFG